MNSKLIEYKKFIKDKNIAVLGMGISNMPLIKFLAENGAKVTAFDIEDEKILKEKILELKDYSIKYSLGKDYLGNLHGFDIIFKTPIIRYDIKELIDEKKRGAIITSEMEVFFDLCPAEIFAVTGSDGKTTTTTLIYKILKEEGYFCWLGGNIGNPLLSKINDIESSHKVVVELSSFQLHTMTKSPNVAIITNISPNHLDIHKTMDEYIEAKMNIFLAQNIKDKLIINYDNKITREFINQSHSNTYFFSRRKNLEKGVFVKDGKIIYSDGEKQLEVINVEDIKIIGNHNVENYLAAILATIDYVTIKSIYNVAITFNGVEHRMELVKEVNGIRFYNDSIGSSPTRTIAGLKSFEDKVVLIAGGYDKSLEYNELASIIIEKVKVLILIGQTGPKIKKALDNIEYNRNNIKVIMCNSLEESVFQAYKSASFGDNIVLSPASASFDMFKNFEERGNLFKKIVISKL